MRLVGAFRRRLTVVSAVIVLVATSGACTNHIVSESDGAGETEARQEPSEFAAELYDYGAEGEWSNVRPLLVEPFDEYDSELLQAGIAFPRWSEDLSNSGQWEIDEHVDFAVARSERTPSQALVLVPDDDSWQYDPGGRALMRIERERAGAESSRLPRETNGMSEDAPYQSKIESDTRVSDIDQHFQRQLGPILPGDDVVNITLSMTLRGAEAARLPLAGTWARDQDETMLDTDLTGTTAVIEDAELLMPLEESNMAAYEVSLNIERPEEAGSIELMFEDLELIEPSEVDEQSLEFDLHYEGLPVETLPEFLEE